MILVGVKLKTCLCLACVQFASESATVPRELVGTPLCFQYVLYVQADDNVYFIVLDQYLHASMPASSLWLASHLVERHFSASWLNLR